MYVSMQGASFLATKFVVLQNWWILSKLGEAILVASMETVLVFTIAPLDRSRCARHFDYKVDYFRVLFG